MTLHHATNLSSTKTMTSTTGMVKTNWHPSLNSEIDQLGDLVLANIFQYVPYADLQYVAKVCSRWEKVVQTIPKTFKFGAETELSEIVRVFNEFPNTIRSLVLNHLNGNINVILRKIRKLQTNLEHLHIDSCSLIKDCPIASGNRLKKVVQSCRGLRSIHLKNVAFNMSVTLDELAQLEYLSCLTIGNNPFVSAVDLVSLVMNCGHLEALHLYRIGNLCDQDLKFMLGRGGRLSGRLRELTLDRVSDLGAVAFESILHCKGLQSLRINYSTGLAPGTVLRMPEELRLLRRLQLERVCRIGSNVLEQLFARVDKKFTLSEFTLIDCCTRFDDATMQAMAGSQSQSLVRLKLRNCLGLRDVSCLFERFPNLREIDLSGCDSLHQLPVLSHQCPGQGHGSEVIVPADDGDKTVPITTTGSSSITKIILPEHLRSIGGGPSSVQPSLVSFAGARCDEQTIHEWDYMDFCGA